MTISAPKAAPEAAQIMPNRHAAPTGRLAAPAQVRTVRILPVHAPCSESQFILDQPFVVCAAYDREEPILHLFRNAAKVC
ncbi:hypothetical protein [Yoonia maritima]|uniref:hypothetical protein n=1 Tax=Yoonia maritima TaxID=1435347 RepID=UPI0013A64EF4